MEVNASLVNFAAGVLSKKFLGRTDLPNFYNAGLLTCENFYPQAQGPVEYRPGFQYVARTRLSQDAMLYPFVFNDGQAYALEFTEKKLRFFSSGEFIYTDADTDKFTFLSHFNGVDGATSYTAETGQVLTFNGAAALDTAQKVFGVSSLLLPGAATDYLTMSSTSELVIGTSNFTISTRIRLATVGIGQTILANWTGSAGSQFLFGVDSSNHLNFANGSATLTGSSTLSVNTWYTVTVVREGTGTNQTKLYVDGVLVTTGTFASDLSSTADITIGNETFGGRRSPFDGWVDELEICKEAVWTSAFTPSTSEYSDSGVKAITAISQASPGVITIGAHGYTGGEQITISDVEGMTELNDIFYLVVYIDADTFSLTDLDAVAINTTAYTAYTSSGFTTAVYEIDTPYVEADLKELQFAQKADLMYIAHPDYAPRKLIRSGDASWALSTYIRTDDPFTKAITAVTAASPGVVTSATHGFSDGDLIQIEDVLGMTELNGNVYKIANKAANTFELTDSVTGANIDTSGFTAYSSVGVAFVEGRMPGAVAFYGGRLQFGGTDTLPESFWGSKAPDNDGTTNYDVFTVGASVEDAYTFPISSQNNTADRIQWFAGTNRFLGIGTYGGVYKANGGSDTDPISGIAINVDPLESMGCRYLAPVRVGSSLFYVQRGGRVLNRFAFSWEADDFKAASLNIFSDEITKGEIKQLAVQQGTTDFIWAVTDTGKLLGMTVKTEEDVSAWHGPHYMGGTDVKVLSACGEPQSDNLDSLWAVVERTIDGTTRRYVEYSAAEDLLPEREDYYTGVEATDTLKYRKLRYEASKRLIRVDSALTLDQSRTVTLTPSAITGSGVTFTAGENVFSASDIGRYIVKKYVTGDESGIAVITAYVSATEVTGVIPSQFSFDSTDEIASGNWYLSATSITGLDHLEGETVRVQIDGADGGSSVVASGAISLSTPGTIIHVGLSYTGRIQSMPLNIGALVGTAQGKITTVNRLGLLIRNTMGTKFGTRLYDLEQIEGRVTSAEYEIDTMHLLETDVKFLNLPDGYDRRKYVHIVQDAPFPCTIQGIVPYVDTTNE